MNKNTKIINGIMWLSISAVALTVAVTLSDKDKKEGLYNPSVSVSCSKLHRGITNQVSNIRNYSIALMNPTLSTWDRKSGAISLQSARDSLVVAHRQASYSCNNVISSSELKKLTDAVDYALSTINH